MQSARVSIPAESLESSASLRVRIGVYAELAKARLSALVVATAAVGYVVAAGDEMRWGVLLITVIGTLLSAFSANAWNQLIEVERDARMQRTRNRPLPSKRIQRGEAIWFAIVTGCAGPAVLWVGANWLAALLALFCEALYVLAYTPLKPRSPLNTLVGAVVGGIPPMIGWAAATGSLGLGAWLLGAILFAWQIPHFLALAWLYREDYERGGFRMLPILDPAGSVTSQACVVYSAMLVPLAVMLTVQGLSGWMFATIGAVLGAAMTLAAVALAVARTNANARRLFFFSLVYLPLLMAVLVLDRGSLEPGRVHVTSYVFLDGNESGARRELEVREPWRVRATAARDSVAPPPDAPTVSPRLP